MTNSNVVPLPDRSSARGRAAAEVRSELAKARISVNRLPDLIGRSQPYWSRRIGTAELPLDIDDLELLGGLLGVPPWRFLTARPQATTPPDSDGVGVLPRLDSNQQPFDYRSDVVSTKLMEKIANRHEAARRKTLLFGAGS